MPFIHLNSTLWEVQPNAPGPSKAHIILIPCIIFSAFSPLMVGIRFWWNLRRSNSLRSDDWCLAISLFLTLVSAATLIITCRFGNGLHAHNIAAENLVKLYFFWFLAQCAMKPAINFARISIVLLYMRVFGGISWFKRGGKGIITLLGAYMVGCLILTVLQCQPVSWMWNRFNKWGTTGKCVNFVWYWYLNASFNVVVSFLLLVLPLTIVWRLNIDNYRKMFVILVFSFSIFTFGISIERIVSLEQRVVTYDPTFYLESTMWAFLEINIGVVSACLPMVRSAMTNVAWPASMRLLHFITKSCIAFLRRALPCFHHSPPNTLAGEEAGIIPPISASACTNGDGNNSSNNNHKVAPTTTVAPMAPVKGSGNAMSAVAAITTPPMAVTKSPQRPRGPLRMRTNPCLKVGVPQVEYTVQASSSRPPWAQSPTTDSQHHDCDEVNCGLCAGSSPSGSLSGSSDLGADMSTRLEESDTSSLRKKLRPETKAQMTEKVSKVEEEEASMNMNVIEYVSGECEVLRNVLVKSRSSSRTRDDGPSSPAGRVIQKTMQFSIDYREVK